MGARGNVDAAVGRTHGLVRLVFRSRRQAIRIEQVPRHSKECAQPEHSLQRLAPAVVDGTIGHTVSRMTYPERMRGVVDSIPETRGERLGVNRNQKLICPASWNVRGELSWPLISPKFELLMLLTVGEPGMNRLKASKASASNISETRSAILNVRLQEKSSSMYVGPRKS
jgi:hypothetical protein